MRTFWLFRTNLRQFEYYHKYTNLEEFKQKCHDFYLLQGIWFLENDVFDEVVIWRLTPKVNRKIRGGAYLDELPKEIVFNVSGKRFIQRFVDKFKECFESPKPTVTFFRGGFPEYGKLTRMLPEYFGLSLYCGTGQRVRPQHGGEYSKILVEDDRDLRNGEIPFYKTANPQIFKPKTTENPAYDICWPCNFSQVGYKGQQGFITTVGKSAYLKGLDILHVGNNPDVGKSLCAKNGVTNIEFTGHVSRTDLNGLLNYSKAGLVTSNQADGSPRIIAEIMATGTPLLLGDKTRALSYYRSEATSFSDSDVEDRIAEAMRNHARLKRRATAGLERLSMDTICKLNLEQWGLA